MAEQEQLGQLEARYALGQQLGEGSGGTVRLCTLNSTGCRYACKSVPKSNASALQHVRREIASLSHLKRAGPHSSIIQVQETLEDADFVHVVMELCSGGDLFHHVTSSASGHLSETQAADVFSVIVQAVHFCHRHRIAHRDIKLENILLTHPLPDGGTLHTDYSSLIRLADFGASANIKHGSSLTDMHGTVPYLSPEFLSAGRHDERVDVWSLGVLLYILLCGYYPFDGDTPAEMVAAIKQGRSDLFVEEPWPSISSLAKDLLRSMLQRDPARRIRLAHILSHPWLLGCPAVEQPRPRAPAWNSSRSCVNDVPCMSRPHTVEARS